MFQILDSIVIGGAMSSFRPAFFRVILQYNSTNFPLKHKFLHLITIHSTGFFGQTKFVTYIFCSKILKVKTHSDFSHANEHEHPGIFTAPKIHSFKMNLISLILLFQIN